jgi:hypothetical protein
LKPSINALLLNALKLWIARHMTLNDIDIQIQETTPKIAKALSHLQYSLNKVTKFPKNFSVDDLEVLESFESFTSRFSRVSDIFCKKLLRSLILKGDPSFTGSLSDHLNQAEKLGYISNSKHWWAIRSLRNKEAHEYTEEDLKKYFEAIINESKFVISEVELLLSKL